MSGFFDTHLGVSMQEFLSLPRDRAAAVLRGRIPDLLYFLRGGRPAHEDGGAPSRTRDLAAGLAAALTPGVSGLELQNLLDRIVTDAHLRAEMDRDQNVYLGPFFTRFLTRAVPDVVFQPRTHSEVERALDWARRTGTGITTRGAGSTAMGGAVPNDGGLLLDMARFDEIHVDARDAVATIGAGARFKQIHARLAEAGFALKSYPSNLGGTLAGWFSAGGLGLNSFKHGPVQAQVKALSTVLPAGEHVRFHADGRLDVLSPEAARLDAEAARAWFESRGYPPLVLGDLAQTAGQLGVILTLSVDVQPLPRWTSFYFEFESEARAIQFARWVGERAVEGGYPPANLKFLGAEHVAAVQRLRGGGAAAKPAVYVDFDAPEEAARFDAAVEPGRHGARRDQVAAERVFEDRFRPQQTKRLGPAYLAAEILVPAPRAAAFQADAALLSRRLGVHLETEMYFLGDGRVLALPGWLSRGPRRGFLFELLLVPALLDLALRKHGGTPYVLGRWQSPYARHRLARPLWRFLRQAKKRLDPKQRLNRGVFFAPAFRVPGMRGLYGSAFPGGVRFVRAVYGSPLSRIVRRAIAAADAPAGAGTADLARAARGCVNCGECNAVCPIFHDARIRLPQMLTHLGESVASLQGTSELLLDLCMRCGNCAEVCQAGIPHLDLYAELDRRTDAMDASRRQRHTGILEHLRHSERYLREFLAVRPGVYLQRTQASLPGEVRYVLFRAENDAGPRDTCIHCGACVPVCPSEANMQYQEADARRITTDLNKCIGCGTCVEVCPANGANAGRTLRVVEAPTREFYEVFAAFESGGSA